MRLGIFVNIDDVMAEAFVETSTPLDRMVSIGIEGSIILLYFQKEEVGPRLTTITDGTDSEYVYDEKITTLAELITHLGFDISDPIHVDLKNRTLVVVVKHSDDYTPPKGEIIDIITDRDVVKDKAEYVEYEGEEDYDEY